MKLEYLFIKTENDFCSTEEQFKNFLQTNMRLSVENDLIEFSGVNMTYALTVEYIPHGKQKDIVFHFEVSVPSEDDVDKLEDFDILIRRINCELGRLFKINTIWDDVSMYYTKLLYPEIANVESLMRKLIYRFMIRVAGGSWYKDTVPEKVKEAIKDTAAKNKVEDLSEDYLHYANFDQLGFFLFEKYSLKSFDGIAVEKLKELLNDPKLKDEVEAFIKNYEPKSNWDRYFLNKVSIENLSEKWQALYKYRNTVAHSKQMNGKEYRAAKELIDELRKAFQSSIDQIDNVKMTDEEVDAVKKVAGTTINPVTNNYRTTLQGITDVIENAQKAYNMIDSRNDTLAIFFNQIAAWNFTPRIDPEMISEITSQYKMVEPFEQILNSQEVKIAKKIQKETECFADAAKVQLQMNESLRSLAEAVPPMVDTGY